MKRNFGARSHDAIRAVDEEFDPETVDDFDDGTAAALRDMTSQGVASSAVRGNRSTVRRPAILSDPVYRGEVVNASDVLRRGAGGGGDGGEEGSEDSEDGEIDSSAGVEDVESSSSEEDSAATEAARAEGRRGANAISAQLAALKREDAASLVGSTRTNDEEMQRSLRARNQQHLWNTCLEVRIMLQQLLSVANQMPQGEAWDEFALRGAASEMATAEASAASLAASLIGVQDALLRRDAAPVLAARLPAQLPRGTRADADALLEHSAALWSAFEPQHDAVITQWSRRANVLSGSALQRKQFKLSSLDQGVIEQVDALLEEREPLLKRTRRRRSELRIFGEAAAATAQQAPSAEIFDDSDFYRSLLRELLESGGVSARAGGGDVGAAAKRAKKRRRVDARRKASKGRKVQIGTLLPKLANFMAPMRPMESSIDADELFASLFAA
jgi:protein AATF/BFR2